MLNQRQSTRKRDVPVESPLWEFVQLNEYKQPSATGASAARLKWASFKRFFMRFETEDLKPLKEESELQSLSQEQLAHVVREVDWNYVAAAFDEALGTWMESFSDEHPVKFVVIPPYAGHGEMLEHWALGHGIGRVDLPTAEQILTMQESWLNDWSGEGKIWVLPYLERCYLRHAQGLKLVRRLLEMAITGELGQGVIGCDSWAWAYLQRVWPIPPWDVWTLQGFDGARLTRLFFHLISHSERKKLRFRNARNGKDVALKANAERHEISPELSQLAVYCRGNFGLARRYWRERLKAEPEQQNMDDGTEQTMPQPVQEDCVWVADVPQEPVLPGEKEEHMAFIMHVLLLHNGLAEAVLPELLPMPHHRIMSLLLRLKTVGILTEQNGIWRITAKGYISAREYLHARDYVLDGF